MTAKTAHVEPGRLTFRAFLGQFVKVPDEKTRRLARLVLHPEQDRFVNAIDARDSAGLRRYTTFVKSWFKKSGKSTTDAALAVWGLVGDDLAGADREIVVIASDLEQSKTVVFNVACKIVQRDPWLRQRCKVGATEIVYREQVRDDATGGRYEQTHVLRAVPQDVRGLHGSSASVCIFDEAWVHDSWDAVESLAPSPARRSPILCFTSYSGLRSQQRVGIPWYDLMARGRAGTDPTLFFSHLGAEGWTSVPWISEAWLTRMRRLYETVPSKFIRLCENRPAPSDSAFLTLEEVQDAIDRTLIEPACGTPGVQYVGALDVGLTHDASAFLIGHVSADSKFVVDVVRLWQGSRAQPVSLTNLETDVATIARRFKLRTLLIDQWQATSLAEQFKHRSLPAQLVTIEPTRLDRLTTGMKGAFARREVRIPAGAHDLIEQIESLDVRETGNRNRRRDLIRFDSGSGGPGVSSQDDLAICLSLCLEATAGEIGRPVMANARWCIASQVIANAQGPTSCVLSGGASPLPGCRRCPTYQSVVAAVARHLELTGEQLSVQAMSRRMRPCELVRELAWAETEQRLLWL
jgi:hypothetical protein